jgi:glycosyltransferase involved in cell wall biosynthesis
MTEEPAISVLIATRNRSALLPRLLASLDRAGAVAALRYEIVVADNGSTDDTSQFLADWQRQAGMRVVERVEPAGKSLALNRAIDVSRAALLAFVDDDEQVGPRWLREIVAFFAAHSEYAAGIGRVLPPPDFWDFVSLEKLAQYRTIPFFDAGNNVHAVQTLHGANMVLRRSVFDAAGYFDRRLGPGAAGALEEIELSQRLLRCGLRIGYMPGVVTYHSIDPTRLTLENARHYCRVAARSAYVIDPSAWRRALPRLLESTLGFLWWSVLRRARRREHARSRMLRHAEMVRLRLARKD